MLQDRNRRQVLQLFTVALLQLTSVPLDGKTPGGRCHCCAVPITHCIAAYTICRSVAESRCLSVQTARSLLKALLAVKAGKKVAGNAAYLNDMSQELRGRCAVGSQSDWLNPEHQIAAFRCAFADAWCRSGVPSSAV